MLKKPLTVLALAGCGALAGCATPYPVGALYTKATFPVQATDLGGRPHKVGTAECTSVLSLFATGDCSIEAAKKNGGITKVHHIDWDTKNLLGLYGQYKVVVYGE